MNLFWDAYHSRGGEGVVVWVEKLKEDPKKYKNQVTHPLRSASISIFSL